MDQELNNFPFPPFMADYSLKKIPHKMGPIDEDGIPLFDPAQLRLGKGTVYHPTVISQHALAHYNNWIKGNQESYHTFIRLAKWLEHNVEATEDGGLAYWPIPFDLKTPPIPAPWMSALTQSEGLSVLLRLYQIEPSNTLADLIREIAHAIVTPVQNGGVLYQDNEISFYEEAGKIHILNGCFSTINGIREYLMLFPDESVEETQKRVIRTVENVLPLYDMGFWSRYSTGIRFNFADMHYHTTHTWQLRYLGLALDNKTFLSFADKWEGYLESLPKVLMFTISRFIGVNITRAMTVLRLNRLKYKKGF